MNATASSSQQGRLARGITWNLASLGVIGASGVIMNFLIARLYGPSALGVFSQVLSIYLVASQLASCGFHFSVLKHVSEYQHDLAEVGSILRSAFRLSLGSGLIGSLVLYLAAGGIGRLYQSAEVGAGLYLVVPGLLCFVLNKILMLGLNGLRRMRLYAVMQALRVVLFLVGIGSLAVIGAEGWFLPLILTFAEVVLLVLLIGYFVRTLPAASPGGLRPWLSRHARFGLRGYLSGLLADINPRIDVLVLGIFAADRTVGIYALASMIAEGISQIPIVVQTNLNPLLAKIAARRDFRELRDLLRRNKRLLMPSMLLVSLAALALYPLAVKVFVGDPSFLASWGVFAILLTGIVLASGYSPFSMYLNQAGRPGVYSLYLLSTVAINTAMNFALVPVIGMYGAALGTLSAWVAGVYLLKYSVLRVEGERI